MLILLITKGIPALGFILLWSMRKRLIARDQLGAAPIVVMERSGKRTTSRNSPRIHWVMGLLYAGLSYFGLPILIWRYGINRALGLVLVPVALGFGLSSLGAVFFSLDSAGDKFLLGLLISMLFQSVVGVYVAINDLKFRRSALFMRGWKSVS